MVDSQLGVVKALGDFEDMEVVEEEIVGMEVVGEEEKEEDLFDQKIVEAGGRETDFFVVGENYRNFDLEEEQNNLDKTVDMLKFVLNI
ncbi:unnamed protein product [Meloidogyne enterolobii]|uniref:Uncharacterized protein n=1 Tax=Meloidogyne enterolobii TaxID=390850 RepID=A0ACB0Y9S7_MELEN